MPHARRYEDIDKSAGRWARTSIESAERERDGRDPMTLQELGNMVGFNPTSEDDLAYIVHKCELWSVKTNVSDEPFWTKLRGESCTA